MWPIPWYIWCYLPTASEQTDTCVMWKHYICLRVGNNKNDNPLFQEEPEIKPCADNMQVCTSLFRYDPQTVLQEGQYCACAGCSNPVWDEEDGMSLTWYHHERGIFSTWNCTRDIHSRASMKGGGGGSIPLSMQKQVKKKTIASLSLMISVVLLRPRPFLRCYVCWKISNFFLNMLLFGKWKSAYYLQFC